MTKSRLVAGLAPIAALVVACAGATNNTATDAGGSGGTSCNDIADSARKEVDAVIEAHRSCTQASDCKAVALSASCFDSCSRAMRADGEAEYTSARAKVDKTQCAQFTSQGCKLIVPPCAPPSPLTCTGGVCTN
ncbi:MAG: hypothetical protein JWP87_3830 [Labilithrix sp.]|nr:hypothetical protein [Labilithrix sp.]